MSAELDIARAQAAEAAVLLALLQRAFGEYNGKLDPPSGAHDETLDSIAHRLVDGGALICRHGGQAIGCIFFAAQPDHLYVGRLSVLPEHRKRGVGDLLLRAAEAHAITLGLPSVRLGVRLVLQALRAYYAARGYAEIALHSHTGYTQPTFVEMEKRLR